MLRRLFLAAAIAAILKSRGHTLSVSESSTGGLISASLLAVPTFAQAQPLTKIRFVLDWRFEGPAALFLVAKAKKYFEQERR